MLLRSVWTLTARTAGLDQIDFPLEITPAQGIRASLDREGDHARLVHDRSVDPARLELVTDSGVSRVLSDGTRQAEPRVRVTGDDEAPSRLVVDDVVAALTFLTDVPLHVSQPWRGHRFVPETDGDREVLARLGTDEAYRPTWLSLGVRTFTVRVDAEGVSALLTRTAGVRLYADAAKLTLDVARFRELWRVLESAFGRTDDKLVALLASFAPALQMRFDKAELQRLLVLRGRASHAQSKAGSAELVTVERECAGQVGRLKSLVERVILTKKSWGYPTAAVEELAPLQAYLGPRGEIVYSSGHVAYLGAGEQP